MWVLAGIAPDDDRAYYDSLYGRMVASWRPDRSASALPPIVYSDLKSTALRVSAFELVPVLLAPVGLALLFLPRMSSSKPGVVIWLRQIFLRSSEHRLPRVLPATLAISLDSLS